MDAASQYAFAYAMTGTAGVRALLALAAASAATHMGIIHPSAQFAWLGSMHAMLTLAVLALVEIAADKIPLLDHAMHVVGTIVRPAAGAVLAGGFLREQPIGILIPLMALGALNAFGVHAAVASIRGMSTVMTGGLANPAISVSEDAGSLIAIALAIFMPLLAACFVLILMLLLYRLARFAYRRIRPSRIR
jgi:uncharacterized membrane protein